MNVIKVKTWETIGCYGATGYMIQHQTPSWLGDPMVVGNLKACPKAVKFYNRMRGRQFVGHEAFSSAVRNLREEFAATHLEFIPCSKTQGGEKSRVIEISDWLSK